MKNATMKGLVDRLLSNDSAAAKSTPAFIGQRASFKTAVDVAERRVGVDDFLKNEFEAVTCTFCATSMSSGSMDVHIRKLCQKVLIRCSLGCGVKVERRDCKSHEERCPKRSISCEKCGRQMWAEEVWMCAIAFYVLCVISIAMRNWFRTVFRFVPIVVSITRVR